MRLLTLIVCVPLSTSCQCSSSASGLGGVGILLLRLVKPDAVLCARRMYADDRVHLCLRHAALEADRDSLSDLAGIRCANMEANNFLIVLFDEDFGVSCALALGNHFVEGPF